MNTGRKVDINDLIGLDLDFMVALATYKEFNVDVETVYNLSRAGVNSTNPAQAFSFMSQCGMTVKPVFDGHDISDWKASCNEGEVVARGPTPEIAICRCFIASKFGHFVSVPKF